MSVHLTSDILMTIWVTLVWRSGRAGHLAVQKSFVPTTMISYSTFSNLGDVWTKIYSSHITLENFSLSTSTNCQDESLIFGFDNGDSRSYCGEGNANLPFEVNRYNPPRTGTFQHNLFRGFWTIDEVWAWNHLFEPRKGHWDLLPYSSVTVNFRDFAGTNVDSKFKIYFACREKRSTGS